MILLGSIERAQLQALLSLQLGRPRRLKYLRDRAAAEKRLSVVSHPSSEDGSTMVNQEVHFQVNKVKVQIHLYKMWCLPSVLKTGSVKENLGTFHSERGNKMI